MYPTLRKVDKEIATNCLQKAVQAGYLNCSGGLYTVPMQTFEWAMNLIKKDRRICWLYVDITNGNGITQDFIYLLIIQFLAGGDWGDPEKLMPGISNGESSK